jgi:cobalt-precorrin-5B (C1)-methyltransferase
MEGRAPQKVEVPLPPFDLPPGRPYAAAHIPVERCEPLKIKDFSGAKASVRKDGGDDPDVTSGALISACLTLEPQRRASPADRDFVLLEGGSGVGRVTLPGLPVPVGQAAINPAPREQIRVALSRYALESAPYFGRHCPPLSVVISVDGGESLAGRTLNPRLGIVGGISILGTHGIVCPFSHEAWKATISQGLEVALASGCRTICLSTGRRSETLLKRKYPELAPQAFIQVADFAAFSLRTVGAMPFRNIVWGCFFGKLLKLSQGMEYTHAGEGEIDFQRLASMCASSGARCGEKVGRCAVAAQALDILLTDARGGNVLRQVLEKAAERATGFAGRSVRLNLFHPDGRFLCAA